jgi:hypothetical protein
VLGLRGRWLLCALALPVVGALMCCEMGQL